MGAERGEGEGGTKKRRPRKRARKSPVSSLQLPAAVFANGLVGDMGGEEGGEGDENLSDLDDEIEEYILTEEQVRLPLSFTWRYTNRKKTCFRGIPLFHTPNYR